MVAKQMTRAAKKAVSDNKKKTVATEALATRTEQLAQHAADSAKNAALKAEDALEVMLQNRQHNTKRSSTAIAVPDEVLKEPKMRGWTHLQVQAGHSRQACGRASIRLGSR